MNSSQLKEMLVGSLRQRVFPMLKNIGYSGPIEESERIKGRQANYFHFTKLTHDGRKFVIAVNVKALSDPVFDIEGGEVPACGIKLLCPEEIIPLEKVNAHMLETRNYLREKQNGSTHFKPRKFFIWINARDAIDKKVEEATKKLADLVEFIERGKPSHNVWSFYNRPQI